ncbi:MAG: aminomethyltransferase family protein [Actinomycetota bacterium]
MSVGTAFYPREAQLNVKQVWNEWSGYFSAACYADFHDIEYNAIREAAAVFDATPLHKYLIAGRDALRLVDRVITRDARRLAVDRVYYTPWCDEDGAVVDDGTVARLAETIYRVTSAHPCLRWFEMNATGLDVQIDDVAESTAALALQGALSREVLEAATRQDWTDVRYFGRRKSEIGGVEVDVTRTGYTGDRGYELWLPADGALDVWDALFEAGRDYAIRPIGVRALDVARTEAGLIMVDVDYTSAKAALNDAQRYSPFELGLGKLVDFGGSDFVGRRALQAQQEVGGPPRRLVGLDIDWTGIEAMFARHDLAPEVSPMVTRAEIPLYKDGKQIGRATSTTWGPTIKKMIALASIDATFASIGTRVSVEWTVEGEHGKVGATVVPLPFLDLERKRT